MDTQHQTSELRVPEEGGARTRVWMKCWGKVGRVGAQRLELRRRFKAGGGFRRGALKVPRP